MVMDGVTGTVALSTHGDTGINDSAAASGVGRSAMNTEQNRSGSDSRVLAIGGEVVVIAHCDVY